MEADYANLGKEHEQSFYYENIIEQGRKNLKTMKEPYLVYNNGWYAIIVNVIANDPLVITGLVLSIMIFALDAGSKVRNIINTSVNGRKSMVKARMTVYAILMLGYVVTQNIMEYIYTAVFIGARCPEAPVKSVLPLCTMDISIIESYILVAFLEYIGVIIAGLMVCLIASVYRNLYLSIVIGVLVFYEGYFLSYIYEWKYMLPEHLFASYQYVQGTDMTASLIVSAIIIFLMIIGIIVANNERSRRIL